MAVSCELLLGQDRRLAEALMADRHYTQCVPSGKSCWFACGKALVVFSRPANYQAARGVLGREGVVWELTRLWAPDGHARNLLTMALAAAVREFADLERGCEALVSYADPNAGHHGGVYQAASWVYLGQCSETRAWQDREGHVHARRQFHSGSRALKKAEVEALGYRQVHVLGKHRYARGLRASVRRELAARSLPYPASPANAARPVPPRPAALQAVLPGCGWTPLEEP